MIRRFAVLAALALLFTAPAGAFDIKTKSIHDRKEAPFSCPHLCEEYGGWAELWRPLHNGQSYCRCNEEPRGGAGEANAGLVAFDSKVPWACVTACEGYGGWNRTWRRLEPDGYVVCGCKKPLTGAGSVTR